MDLSLAGRRALVCGSSQGIGRAAATELALLGAHITLMARDRSRLEAVQRELPAPGEERRGRTRNAELGTRNSERGTPQKHALIVADFADPDAVRAAIEPAIDPAHPFHILVNNTGGPPSGLASESSVEAYLAAFRMHVLTNHVLVEALLPGFKRERYGRIINIISTSVKAPIPGLGVSNTVRAAVANWAKTLAAELAPFGITVNNILPGFTDTARLAELFNARAEKSGKSSDQARAEAIATIPAGRLGRPEEVAAAVAFLASPAAAYINGINLPVDGGRTQSL